MPHLRLTVAYDGTGFAGYARQPGLRTVQEELERAVGRVYPVVGDIHVAGRTDAGVHATGQVVSIRVDGGPPAERAGRAIDAQLADDISVVEAVEAREGFHARHSARARAYRYRIRATRARDPFTRYRAAHVSHRFDHELFRECFRLVHGTHDFRAFTPSETQHRSFTRTILASRVLAIGDELHVELAADAFLRHQVRTLVGTALEVARGRRPLDGFHGLLGGAPRADGGPTAPPWGLTLVGVRYEGEPEGTEWSVDSRRAVPD